MSLYYTPLRTKNIFNPDDNKPFKLSRSKIDLFLECPRCFFLDRKLGVGRPPGFPFTLNSAIDTILKREFDIHRASGKPHSLIEQYGIDAKPVSHKDLEKWRDNFAGIQYLHEPTNLLIFGAIDDLWQNSKGEYIIVDYKATAKREKITAVDQSWQIVYKRQMEIYQWLLRKNELLVSDTGYFVYCNGNVGQETFNAKLEFDLTLIPYLGNDEWIEQTIIEAHKCLLSNKVPDAVKDCDYCAYRHAVQKLFSKK